MAGLGTGAPIVKVYHEKSMILPDVSRVLACLYEKDLQVERHPSSSYKSLLTLQASSHVPVPFDDGLTFLEDSREICRYVAETYEHHGYPFLLGKDSLERASIEQWLHHEEHAFNPPSRSLFCHLAFPLAEEDDDIDLHKRKLEEVLEVYEQRLGDSEFLAGNQFTLADLVHLPNSHHIRESDKFVYLYDSRKNVQRWWNDISRRDSWQKVLKDIQVVEQQRKQEELEKQQQRQWLREHPPRTGRGFRLDSRRQASTKSQTILVPPPGIISTSPTASQAEKPLPTETFPDETLLSTPTPHKSSAVQSKRTTIFTTQRETPPVPAQSTPRLPGYPHIPVQSTSNSFIPATSPTTAENPSRTSADKPEVKGVSLPSEATEIDLTANSKRSSSNEVSQNLRVFHFYEASSHTDDAEPYIEPATQKPSDRISETDGPSNATDHVKTSPGSVKEDSGAPGFWTDNTATNADTLDKKSVRYTEHSPQRPVETIYGGSTDQKATYTSPGKHGLTEVHQELQTKQWHGTAAGLSNLKGETDSSMPTQQVEPGKDVQHRSSQDSEQVSSHPLAREPVSMDRQLIQGPEMTPRTLYTDQKRDVSSMLWQKTADVRGIAEEEKASSDYRDGVLPPYAQKHAEEAKLVSADHRKDASQDAAPPPKQAASEGPRRVTAPYPAAQDEFIKQSRESPASRSTVPRVTQGSTEEETVDSSSSKAHLLDSHLADAHPPKKFLDEDGYGSSASLQTGYGDDPYNRNRDRDASAPKRMMSQDAFEETKMTDFASSEAQALDHQQADAPQQKPRSTEGPQTTGSPLKKRSGGEDTTKHSKDASSRPGRMAAQEVQDILKETKAGDSLSAREPPSDTWRAPPPLPRRQVDDDHSTTTPTQKRYPGTGGTIKEVEENTSMPRQVAGGDAKETSEKTKFAGSAASRAQPPYYHGIAAPSRQQDAIEDPLGATSPLERRYADIKDTTKHSRDTAFKPSKMVGQDAEDSSEEAEARNSTLFRAQPQDARRVATTPSKQAAEDALSVSQSSTKRYPRAEETSKQPSDTRLAASKPTPIAAQGARDIFRESKVADPTSSIEQPSDARAAASFQKQEVPDARNTSASLQKRYPDVKGSTKKSKVTFEETTSPDSASSRVQPSDSHRVYDPSSKKEATEAPHEPSPFKQRHSDVEDTTKQSDGAFKPRKLVGQDTQGIYEETKASESGLLRDQYSDPWQAATTPTEKVATEDGPGVSPPSDRNVPSDEDTTTRPRGTASAPRQTTAGDASGTFQDSSPADSVSSREQPLGARQPVVTSSRQETEDSLRKISAFHKTRPFIEDSTGQGVDTVFGPMQIGAEDAKQITEETNVTDSASSVRARPTYTPRTARPLSEQVEVEKDARDKGRKDRETFSTPEKMVPRDAEDTFGERKTPRSVSTEQFFDNPQASSPPKQAKHSQGVKGVTKKSEDVAYEETKSPDSALSRVQPSDSQRDYAPSWKKEATEAPRATSPFKQRHSDVEDTAKHSRDNVFKPRQMVSQDTQGTYEETKASDFGLLREQSSDPWQAATTPTEKVATEDGSSETPPSERNAPSDEDTNMRPRGTASAPRRATAEDARGTFQDSKPADSVLSREQPLSARQPGVTPSRQETEDSHSKISEFHKTRPFVEDSTRQGVDTVVGPRQSGAEDAKDITEETKIADSASSDSASSVKARPTYTPRIAHPLSEQAEVEEDARDKDREGRETTSAPKKMVSSDGEHTYGERKIPHSASREQSLDNLHTSSPLKQAAAEDPRGATRGAKESLVDEPKSSQGIKGASKKSVGTSEETDGPGSTLPKPQPVSAQDAQRTDRSSRTPTADQRKDAPTQLQSNLQDTYKEAKSSSAYQKGLGSSPSHAEAGDDDQAIMGEKAFSSEQLRKMPKESRSASTKGQPADPRGPTKVERTPSVYQEDHLVAPDSRQQPQILPTGVRADGSTPKRQQAPVVPSTSEEKSTPSTPPRAKAHDDHTTEEPVKRDTVDNTKGAPLLLGREPTSQVQHATELTPDGDMSNKPSSIDQWRLTSVPIQGVTRNSGDDQKPTPMSQQSIPSARGADEMVKGEKRMVPSASAGAQTPDVQQAPPSFAGADMAERDGGPVQMQVPTLQAHPTSVPTRRTTPDARDTSDSEFVKKSDAERWKSLKAKHDSAMTDEDVSDASLPAHDATGDSKTTWHATEAQVSDTLPGSTANPVNVRPTSGDDLVERFSRDQGAKPPESTQAQTPSDAPHDSVSTQGVPSDALDKAKYVKPSSTEGMRPTAGPASALEPQLAEHKFAPSDEKSARAAQPLSSVESRKEDTSVSAADQTKKPQTIFRQEARPSTPITKQVPSSKIQQVTLDNLPTADSRIPHVPNSEQVSHTPQTIPSERDMTPVPDTSDSPASNNQIASAEVQKAIPHNYHPDELTVPFVSSEKQGSYDGSSTEPHEGPSYDAHGAAHDKDVTKDTSRQAPVLEYRPDSTAADSYVRPTSGDEPGISPHQGAESPKAAQATNSKDQHNEVYPAEKKFAPSDKDLVHSFQPPSPAETRKRETIVAATEQTLPKISQQHTQDMREAPTSDSAPAQGIPSDPQSVRPGEVALAGQKFTSSDQDTLLTSSVEPRNEDIRNSTRSAKPLSSAEDDQTKDPQKTTVQQGIEPTPGTSKSPSSDTHHASGQFHEVAPDDQQPVDSLPSQGQVSHAKPSFLPSEGPTHDSYSDIGKKTTKLPSSQAQSSDPKPDPTQSHGDGPPTRFLSSQLPKQHEETQALPPLMGPYDSKPSQDVTSDALDKAKSLKPSSIDQEAMGSALTPDTHLGSAPGEVAPAGQKLVFKGEDSAHPTENSSSSEPTKEQSTVTAPNEAKPSPTVFSQQNIALAQTKMKDPSSGPQYVPQRLQEITPEDQRITGSTPRQQDVPHSEYISKPDDGPTPDPHGAFVEEPMAHITGPTPHAQNGMAPSGLSPDVEKFEISDKDSDHHGQLSSSAGSRKEEGDVDASDETIMPAPSTVESSGEVRPDNLQSSELTKPLTPNREQDSHGGHPESHEGPNPDARRDASDENTLPLLVSQAPSLESGINSAPSSDDIILTSGDEPVARRTNEHEKQTPAAFQASLPPETLHDSIYAKSVSADAFGEVGPLKVTGEVTPADQIIDPPEPHPVVESRKESTGAEAEESKVYQPVTGQKDIKHAPGITEHVVDDDHNKEPVSREEQVSHDQRASEPREGSPPDVHGASLDKTTPPFSEAKSPGPKRDSLPKSVDVNPSSGQQSTTGFLRGQGAKLPGLTRSPESNENVPKSFKPLSANQEVTSPKEVPAPAPDTLLGTASDELAPDGKNFPLSAQGLARPAQRPFSVEPTKEKGIVASSDQTIEEQTIIAQQGVTPSTDKEKTPFEPQASELTKPPNEDQEQVHSGSAYEQREEPILDARGAVDEMMPHPSSQAKNSDIPTDSAPISGDTHRASVDGPTTSSRDSEAQPPTGNQIVPAFFLEKIESPTPPSTDQEQMTPMTSPTPAPEAPQDQDLATTSQLSPSVVSRKDVSDQTNVAQADLREPASSGSTHPSEKAQEFSPDAYTTKSGKSLPPMKGADPVQPPDEASLDLSSDEKTTMIKGDQASTISNVNLSVSQAIGQPENSAVKGPLSEESVSPFSQKNLERTSPEEKSKQVQQIDQPSTGSSKDDSIEARRTANPNILTASQDIQESPVKESMQEAQGSRNQQQVDQAVFQSTQNEMQTEAQDNGSDDHEEIKPDSAPISGASSDGKATSSLPDSQSQPSAGTMNVPAVFLEKIESPRRPSTHQELMTPMTSPSPAPDTTQDEDSTQSPQLSPSVVSRKDITDADQTDAGLKVLGSSDATLSSEKLQEFSPDASVTKSAKPLLPMTGTDPVQSPHEAFFDLSSPEEKTKQQQQTDQSNTRLSNDDSMEASRTANPNILTNGDLHPSPLESMHATEGSRNQEQVDQAVFQSKLDNEKQIQQNETQDNGFDRPEEIRPGSAPISGDARRTSGDGTATRSLRASQEPPAGALNVPAAFLEKMEPPRPPSTDQEPMTSKTSPAPALDAQQDRDSSRTPQLSPSVVSRKGAANADQTNVSQAGLREPANSEVKHPSEKTQEYSPDTYLAKSEKPLLPMEGSNPVQTPNEASFYLSSNEKPTRIKGEQVSTISDVSLSASQPVGQSENSAVKGPLSGEALSSFSQKNLERTLPEEKPKQQQQTDQSSPRPSKDDSTEASGTASPNILPTSRDVQPSPPLKESMQTAQGSRNQRQAGQAVFQAVQDNKNQTEETEAQDNGSDEPKGIRPDSAPISGDARRTSDDGPATSYLRDSRAQPPAGTLNAPPVFLENIKSPRPPFTDQEHMTPMTSPALAPDAPKGTDPVQPPHEASLDLSSNEKPTTIKGDQANTISNVDLSASQAVDQSENSSAKGRPSEDLVSSFSQKSLEGTSTEEKPNQRQRTDQSNTRSPKGDSILEARGTTDPGIPTSGDVQPSPLKESTQATEGSRNQQQADQAVFESTLDDENQSEETEARVIGPGGLYETNLQQSRNKKNKGASQKDALGQAEEDVPAKDAPGGIQEDNRSASSPRTSEESEQQVQTEGKTQGGESKAPAAETGLQTDERDLPSSNKSIASQSQAETPSKLEEQASSGTQRRGTDSRKLDGSTDDTKSAGTDNNPPSS